MHVGLQIVNWLIQNAWFTENQNYIQQTSPGLCGLQILRSTIGRFAIFGHRFLHSLDGTLKGLVVHLTLVKFGKPNMVRPTLLRLWCLSAMVAHVPSEGVYLRQPVDDLIRNIWF